MWRAALTYHGGMNTRMAYALVLAGLTWSAGVLAQAPAQKEPAQKEPPPGISYGSVAAALKDLQSRDGQDTVVSRGDGWITINEPMASAQWSFPPGSHPAHPAVLRRTMQRGTDGQVHVRTDHLCEGPAAACQALLAEFALLNERIEQARRGRGRPAVPTAVN